MADMGVPIATPTPIAGTACSITPANARRAFSEMGLIVKVTITIKVGATHESGRSPKILYYYHLFLYN